MRGSARDLKIQVGQQSILSCLVFVFSCFFLTSLLLLFVLSVPDMFFLTPCLIFNFFLSCLACVVSFLLCLFQSFFYLSCLVMYSLFLPYSHLWLVLSCIVFASLVLSSLTLSPLADSCIIVSFDIVHILTFTKYSEVPRGLTVRIAGFHPAGPGSTPGVGTFSLYLFTSTLQYV